MRDGSASVGAREERGVLFAAEVAEGVGAGEPGDASEDGKAKVDVSGPVSCHAHSSASTACCSAFSSGAADGASFPSSSVAEKSSSRATASLRLRAVGGVRSSLGRLPTARSARLPW